MALKDIQTNKNDLKEYLLLIAKVPEKVNKIDIDIKKELLIDIDNRISSITETICGLISSNKNYNYPEIYLPDKLFDYWALNVSQLFTYNELTYLKKLITDSIETLEAIEPKAININPFDKVFINYEVYSCFLEYTKKHILDFYSDYSYLKKRLEHEELIHYHKDTGFLNLIFNEMQLIKKYEYDSYFTKYDSKFKSLKSSYSEHRENNFNNIFKGLF